jgi:hypothetical protein
MRQIALYLATIAALALPGAAMARPPHAMARPPLPAFAQHPQGFHHHGKPYPHALVPFDSYGWPVVVPVGGGRDIVTHDFVDPRFYGRPRLMPRSVDVVSDTPVVFREPVHIIELGRHKRRAPITVVRRGVISQE